MEIVQKIICIIVIVVSCLLCVNSLDKELLEMEPSQLGLKVTEHMIRYYNRTAAFEDQFNRLLRYNPFEDGIAKVELLLKSILDLKKDLKKVQKLLQGTRSQTDKAKQLFIESQERYKEYSALLKHTTEFLDPSSYVITNPIVEKVTEEYEQLKPKLHALIGKEQDDFVDGAFLLYKNGLFASVVDFVKDDIEQFKREKPDLNAVTQLNQLFREWEVLRLKEIDAMIEEDVETEEGLKINIEDLTNKLIPDFLLQNRIGLSKFVALTVSRLVDTEKEFNDFDIELHFGKLRGEIVMKMLECKNEDEQLFKEKRRARKLYGKLTEENSESSKHSEL